MNVRLVVEADLDHVGLIEQAVALLVFKHPGTGAYSVTFGDGLEGVLTVTEDDQEEDK